MCTYKTIGSSPVVNALVHVVIMFGVLAEDGGAAEAAGQRAEARVPAQTLAGNHGNTTIVHNVGLRKLIVFLRCVLSQPHQTSLDRSNTRVLLAVLLQRSPVKRARPQKRARSEGGQVAKVARATPTRSAPRPPRAKTEIFSRFTSRKVGRSVRRSVGPSVGRSVRRSARRCYSTQH